MPGAVWVGAADHELRICALILPPLQLPAVLLQTRQAWLADGPWLSSRRSRRQPLLALQQPPQAPPQLQQPLWLAVAAREVAQGRRAGM